MTGIGRVVGKDDFWIMGNRANQREIAKWGSGTQPDVFLSHQ